MAAPPTPPQKQVALNVPPDVAAKFGPLIELIKKSESMNDEERQYWVNTLPSMTPDQVQNLQSILDNEVKQLAAIDSKYQTEVDKLGQAEIIRRTEEQRTKQRTERTGKESAAKRQEDKATEDILKQIESDGQAR